MKLVRYSNFSKNFIISLDKGGNSSMKKKGKQKFSMKLMWKQRYLLLMSVPFVIWLIIFKYIHTQNLRLILLQKISQNIIPALMKNVI